MFLARYAVPPRRVREPSQFCRTAERVDPSRYLTQQRAARARIDRFDRLGFCSNLLILVILNCPNRKRTLQAALRVEASLEPPHFGSSAPCHDVGLWRLDTSPRNVWHVRARYSDVIRPASTTQAHSVVPPRGPERGLTNERVIRQGKSLKKDRTGGCALAYGRADSPNSKVRDLELDYRQGGIDICEPAIYEA